MVMPNRFWRRHGTLITLFLLLLLLGGYFLLWERHAPSTRESLERVQQGEKLLPDLADADGTVG